MAYFQSFFTNYSYDHLAMYHERFKRNNYYINIKGREIFNHVFKFYIRNGIDVNIVFAVIIYIKYFTIREDNDIRKL